MTTLALPLLDLVLWLANIDTALSLGPR